MNNIIIFGGELFNKGAQAMTFNVVSQLKKHYPKAEIFIMSSMDYKRPKKEKEQYNFKIYDWSIKDQFKSFLNIGESKKIFNDADLVIDISGFALSSKRGIKSTIKYLLNINVAKNNKIPMYLLPQSFGPFNYPKGTNNLLNLLIKNYIKYPIIYAREDNGYSIIKHYNESSYKEIDIVLGSIKPDTKAVFLNAPILKELEIKGNSVAIIPNKKIFDKSNKSEGDIYKIYYKLIKSLLSKNKNVYLFSHSKEDLIICKKLKERYSANNNVILLEEELNCIEIENLLFKFDYIIASRYHSIIHAYKSGTPAIVIGWAVKYEELLNVFSQTKYLHSIDEEDIDKTLIDNVFNIEKQFSTESIKIKNTMSTVEKENYIIKLLDL